MLVGSGGAVDSQTSSPPLGEWPKAEGCGIISRVTTSEVARELELLRPYLKELMVMGDARDRVKQGSAFTQRDPPDVTIDKLITLVLTDSRMASIPMDEGPSGAQS